MYEDNLLAGRGLRLLFVSELLSLISSLMGVSLLGGILFLVSTVMSIGALNVAAPSHPYFGRAFWVNIVSLVLNGLVLFAGAYQWTGLVAVLSVVILALGVYYVYLVCTAAGQLRLCHPGRQGVHRVEDLPGVRHCPVLLHGDGPGALPVGGGRCGGGGHPDRHAGGGYFVPHISQ